MSGVIRGSFDNFWNFSVSPSSIPNNKEIGKKLTSVRAEQIKSIVDVIYDTLWDRLNLKHNPKVTHWLSPKGSVVESDAKSLLLKKMMFISDLENHFAAGEASILLLGYPIEYSYEEILKYAVLFGEISLPFLIGPELAARHQYRISFSLALERTKDCDELSFFIIEREGKKELLRALYAIE